MPSSRERKAAVFGAAVLAALLLIPIDTGGDFFVWGPVFDAGHFGLFFIVTLAVSWFLERLPIQNAAGKAVLLTALVASGAEIVQPIFERSASWIDLTNGLLGVCAGGITRRVSARGNKAALAGTLIALAALQLVLFAPAYRGIRMAWWRQAMFPVIATFEDPQELLLWQPVLPKSDEHHKPLLKASERSLSKSTSFSGSRALEIRTHSGYYSGVSYAAGNLPWADYSALTFRIFNPSAEVFTVYIRIDDDQKCETLEDRFGKAIELAPGETSVRVAMSEIENGPVNRKLNTARIQWFLLFVDDTDADREFSIDDIKLE